MWIMERRRIFIEKILLRFLFGASMHFQKDFQEWISEFSDEDCYCIHDLKWMNICISPMGILLFKMLFLIRFFCLRIIFLTFIIIWNSDFVLKNAIGNPFQDIESGKIRPQFAAPKNIFKIFRKLFSLSKCSF